MAEYTPDLLRDGRWSRRTFVGAAALAATGIVETAAAPADGPAANPQAAKPAKPSPLALAQAQVILMKHGQRLSASQTADVRRLLADAQKTGQDLRAFPLDNSDEPALVFHAPSSPR